MGKLANFSIIIQKENPVYYCDESVIDNVNIGVSEKLKYNSISMVLSGKGKVFWYKFKLKYLVAI